MSLIEILKTEFRILKLDVLIARQRRRKLQLIRRLRASRSRLKESRAEIYKERQHALIGQIGLMAMGWAQFEASLDGCISCIHHNGGKSAIQPDLPVSLKTKLAYLRKASRVISAIASLANDVNATCDQTQKLKIIRHDYLHGIAVVEPESFNIRTTRYAYEGSQLRLIQRTMTQHQVYDALHELARLDRQTVGLLGRLGTALQDEQTIEAFGKLQVGLAAISLEEEDAMRPLSD